MSDQLVKDTRGRMSKAEDSFRRELQTVRAGNANPSLLNHITADYYGVATPINQIAQVSVPEPRLITVKPYDKTALSDIERAITISDIGINPSSDGEVIRLAIPALTEERRKEIAKKVGEYEENAKIAVRNIRRDAMDDLKKNEKNGEITEDDLRFYEDEVQKVTDESIKSIEEIAKEKENEIMDV